MVGSGEDLVRRASLHDVATIQDHDAVGQVLHDLQVVRDEEVGRAPARLQLLQEVEHRGLHGDVQARDRLVADHEPGACRKGTGDGHALLFPAAQLAGVALHVALVEVHGAQ